VETPSGIHVLYPAAKLCSWRASGWARSRTIANPSQALNRYENYRVDTAIPEHHVTFNGIAELR